MAKNSHTCSNSLAGRYHLKPHNSRAPIDACVPYERRETFARVVRSDPVYLAETDLKWRSALNGDT